MRRIRPAPTCADCAGLSAGMSFGRDPLNIPPPNGKINAPRCDTRRDSVTRHAPKSLFLKVVKLHDVTFRRKGKARSMRAVPCIS